MRVGAGPWGTLTARWCRATPTAFHGISSVMIATIHWTLANTVAIAAVATGIAAIGALGIGIWQTLRMRTDWQVQNALAVLSDMQSDFQREARGCIFRLKGDGIPFTAWTVQQKHQADIVLAQLNIAAYLAQNRLLPKRMLRDLWGDIMRRSYEAGFDRVTERRKLGEKNLWESFTAVAEQLLREAPANSFYPTSPANPQPPSV